MPSPVPTKPTILPETRNRRKSDPRRAPMAARMATSRTLDRTTRVSEARMLKAATTVMSTSRSEMMIFCMAKAMNRFLFSVFQSMIRRSGPSRASTSSSTRKATIGSVKRISTPKMDWRALPRRLASSSGMKARRASYS